MRRIEGLLAVALVASPLVGCRPEARRGEHKPVEPPVSSPASIPNAPLSGTIRGAPFVIRDARYVADHRVGYLHTDIKLSAGKADAACGDIKPADSTSVWLRLEGSDKVDSQEFKLAPGQEGPWSVHYQVHTEAGWFGDAQASAVVSVGAAGPNGVLSGSIAVCFADGDKSCVSGSFHATPCPYRIDAPVRGAEPPEAVPEKYRAKLKAVPADSATPSASPSATPSASPSVTPSASPSTQPSAAPSGSASAPPQRR